MTTSLGDLALFFCGDTKNLEQSIADAKRKAVDAARDIEKVMGGIGKSLSIAVKINDSELPKFTRQVTELNNSMRSNPVKIQLELSSLNALETQIERIKLKLSNLSISTDTQVIPTQPRSSSNNPSSPTKATETSATSNDGLQVKPNIQELDIALDEKEIGDEIGRAVSNSIKKAKSGSLFGSVFTGAFENLGASLTGRLGTGISSALEESLASKIGSFDLLGKALFDRAIPGLVKGIGNIQILEGVRINDIVGDATKKSGLKENLEKAVVVIQEAIGKDEIEIEKRLLSSRKKSETASRHKVAAKELGEEYQSALGASGIDAIQLEQYNAQLDQLKGQLSRSRRDLQGFMSMSLDEKVLKYFNEQLSISQSTIAKLKTEQQALEDEAMTLIEKEESGTPLTQKENNRKGEIEFQYESVSNRLAISEKVRDELQQKKTTAIQGGDTEKEAAIGAAIKARTDKVSETEELIAELEKKISGLANRKDNLENLLKTVGVEGVEKLPGQRILAEVAVNQEQSRLTENKKPILEGLEKLEELRRVSQERKAKFTNELDKALANSEDEYAELIKQRILKETETQKTIDEKISRLNDSLKKLESASQAKVERAKASVPDAEFRVVQNAGVNKSAGEISKDVALSNLKNLSKTYQELFKKLKDLDFASNSEMADAIQMMTAINEKISGYEKAANEALKEAKTAPQKTKLASGTGQSAALPKSTSRTKLPAAYQDIIQEVSSITGIEIQQSEIPKLKAFSERELAGFKAKGIKANAAYEQGSNTLYLTPDQLQALITDNLAPRLTESVTHELVHGLQGEFGRLPIDQVSKKRQMLRPTAAEYAAIPELSEHIESSTSNAPTESQDIIRAKEQDAYIFAARNRDKIFESVSRKSAVRQAEQVAGAGGGKLTYQLKKLEADQIKELAGLLEGATYDTSSALSKIEAKFSGLRQITAPYVAKLRNIDALPEADIRKLTETVQVLLEKVNQSAASYAKQVHEQLKTEAQAELKAQLQGGFTSKDDLVQIARTNGIGVSGTKSQITERLVNNVDINKLRPQIPELNSSQKQVVGMANELQSLGSAIPQILKEEIQSSRQTLKELKAGLPVENPLPDLENQYQLVLELLSRGLEDDVHNYLQGAKLQIAKLRKEAVELPAPAALAEGESEGAEANLDHLLLAGSFSNPLEAAKAKLQQVVEAAKMGQSVKKSNQANASAAEAMAQVYEASLRQTDAEINKAMAAFDEYEAKAFQEAQQYIEARMAEYEQAILHAEENTNEQVNLENAYVRHGNVQELQRNAKLLSEQELKGNVVNYGNLQTPEAVKQMAGKKPEGDTLNLIAEAIGDMFSGIAERVRKQSDILQLHIPSLMTDIATSAVAGGAGDTDEQNRLMGYHAQLSGNQARMQELSQKTQLDPEETKELQALNMATQDIFKSLNVAVPQVNGFFDALTKGGGILGTVLNGLKGLVGGFLAFQGAMFLQNFMAGLASATMDAAVSMESLERRIGFVSGSAAEGAKNLAYVKEVAKGLGTDVKASLEGFAGLASSSRETALEGEPTRQIFKGVSQASTVYDLDGEQQGRVFAAVQQMASKGKVSAEELRQQLGESLPGAFQVAARAMGMTTAQLDKMMSTGQLLSEDFLPKFAQQLSAETQSGVAGAANSSVSAMIGFNNALFETEAALGKAFLPARNAVLSALAGLLNFVAKNAETLVTVAQFLGIAMGVLLVKNISTVIASIAKIPGVAATAQAAMSLLGKSIQWQGNKDAAASMIEGIGSAIGGFKNAPLASSKQAIASLAESVSTFATGSISNAKQSIGSFVGGLTNLRGTATGIGQSFVSAAGGIKAFGMSAATNGLAGLMTLAGGIRAIMAALAPLLVQFLLFQAVVGIFKMVSAAMSDTSGDTREFADTATKGLTNYRNALAEARGETKQFVADMKNTRSETLLDAAGFGFLFPKQIKDDANWFDKARFSIGKGITGGIEGTQKALGLQTWEDKKFDDQQSAIGDARAASNQVISEQYTMLGANGKGARELAKMKEIDKELETLNTKRRASASLNPEDKAALRAFDEQQALLLKQREAVSKPIGILQAASQSNIDSLKKQIEKYESLASEPGAHQAEYRDTLAGLKSDLEAAQTAQEKFNRSVGEAVNAFTLLQRNVQKVQDELADTADRQALVSNRAKTQTTLNAITNNVTPGQVQKQTNDQAISDLADKLTRTTKAYTSTVALTNTAEADTVRKAYGVTSETGQAELKTLADKAKGSGDTKAEYFLNQFGAQKKTELDISQIQSELANAEKAAKDQLDQSNRAIADYYRSVDKQTQELAITAEESSIKIAAQQMKNKVLDAMSGFQDNVFTQLADSIVNILDELNKPIEEQLNAQKQIQSNNFGYQDQLRQVNSLRRNSPDFQGNEQDLGLVLPNGTNLNQQSIPVSIDIQNLDSSKLDELNQKIIGVTKPSVDEVNASTQSLQGSIATSGQVVSGTLNPAIDSAKSSSDILNASLGTQSGTIQNNAAEMSGFSLSTDTSKNASDILAASLGEHAPLIQGNAATMTGFTGTTDTAKEASDKVQKSLAVHAPTINTATKAQSAHGSTMQQNMGIAAKVAQTLLTWTNPLGAVIKLTIDWFKTIANNIPLLGQVQQAMSGIGGSLTGSAQNMLNSMSGSGAPVAGENPGGYTIYDSNRGHQVKNMRDLTEHHLGRAGDGYRRGQLDGEEEEWAKDGSGRLVKDMVIKGKGGSADGTGTYLPAGGTGTLFMTPAARSGGYGNLVTIKLDAGGEIRMAHLNNFAPGLQNGQRITAGQIIGQEGSTGHSTGTHLHFEADPKIVAAYVDAVATGNFDKLRGMFANNAQTAINAAASTSTPQVASKGGSIPNLGTGYSSIQRMAGIFAGNPYFNTGTAEGRARLAITSVIGGSEMYGKGSTGTDFFSSRGGTGNNMLGALQYNRAYNLDKYDTPEKYINFTGEIFAGKRALPNGRQGMDYGAALNQAIASGQIKNGDDLVRWMRANKLGGSNWQGVDDGIKRIPGLADTWVQWLKSGGAGGQPIPSVAQQSGVAVTTPALTVPQVWVPEGYGGDSTGQQALNQAANQAGVNNASQNQQAQAQANANGDAALIQARKQLQSASEQLRQQMIQQREQSIRNERFVRDENLSSQIQTPEVQYQQSTNKINDQFDDAARNNGELIRKLQSTLDAGKALQTLLPQIDNTDELIKKLQDPEYQKKNPGMDTAKLISELQRSGLGGLKQQIDQGVNQTEKDLAAAKQLQGQYEELRNKKLAFEAQEKAHKDQLKQEELKDSDIQNQAKLMEAQIAAAKQYQQTHPFDTSQGDPIEMQKTLDLLNEELSIRKQIRDIEEKKRSDPANSKAYDNQIAQLKEQDKQLRANIETRTKLESDQRQADQAKAILENKQFAAQMSNDLIAARSQATDLFIKNHPFDFSQGDPLKDKYQSDFASLQIEGESKLADFDEKNRLGKFIGQSAEDIAKLRQGIVDLNALKLDNLQAEFEQTFKEREQQRLDFLLNQKQQLQQSDLDVLSAQQGNLSAKGLSTQSNVLGKKIAIAQQGMSFEKQIRELEKLAATGQITAEQFDHMKSNAEQLNDVKLQGIQDQFSPWTQALTGMQGSFKGFFADVLSGSKSLKDAFKDMVNSILSNLANMAAEWLTNKLFGDIFGLGKSKKSGSQWFAGSMAGNTKQQETPMNNIVPFTNPANATGFAQGVTLGTNPMQPMYVQDVSQQPFGQIAKGGDLFGGSGSILDGMAKGSFFSGVQMKPMQVDMVSAANNVFDPITQGFSGVMQGLGGLFGGGTGGSGLGSIVGTIGSAIGGGGMGGMGGGAGSLISTGLSLVSSIFGFADGGKVGEGGLETKIPNYANGKLSKGIEEAMQRERMQSGGRTPQLAVLNTDELVLSAEQTEKFEKMGGMRILNFANGRVPGGSFAQAVAEKTSNNVNISVPINFQGSGSESGIDEQKIKTVLDSRVRKLIEEESRPGGSLSSRFAKR